MPILIPPIPIVVEPETDYDRSLVTLELRPRFTEAGEIEAVMIFRAMPYRVLADGQIDTLPAQEYVEIRDQVFADSAADPVLGQAAADVMAAIQTFLTARLTPS